MSLSIPRAVGVFLLAVLLGGSMGTAHGQSVSFEGERPWGRDRLDHWLAREVVPGPDLPDAFPEIRIDRPEEGAIRAEFPQADFRDAWPGTEILRADPDGRIVLPGGGGTLSVAAVATAYHSGQGRQSSAPEWRDPISREPLDAATVAALGIPEERQKLRGHAPNLGSQVKFVLHPEGVENLLWISGALTDSQTLGSLSQVGVLPRDRDETAVYDFQGPIWHDGPVTLQLEFAWGEFVEAEGPATPGTTLRVPGAMAGLFALQDGKQRGGSFGRDDPSYVVSRFVPTEAEEPACIAICGFLPYWEGRSADLELVDRNGTVAVSTAWNGSDYVFPAHFEGVRAEEAETFRMKVRPHWARAIVELPGLPNMPNARDQLTDNFDLRVPFAKFGNLGEMLTYISNAAQIGHLGFTGLDERPGVEALEFPRDYRDATLREMLRDITDAAGVDVRVDPETFRATVEAR
ncbi:hypothetical protein BH23VER1_BH23VER1_35950 [soil metagenome]